MAEQRPIRIHVERYHMERDRHLLRGIHEWQVRVMRGSERLSNPPAYGRDLPECARRAVGRAREQLQAERIGMTGWPACEELGAAHV